MRKAITIAAVIGAGVGALFCASRVEAAVIQWDRFTTGQVRVLGAATDRVNANNFNATSTSATSTLPVASSTKWCIAMDCITDVTGSGLSVSAAGVFAVGSLTTANFTSANVSQWTNDANYVTTATLGAAPFTWGSFWNFNAAATTSPIHSSGNFTSSSTVASQFPFASSTALTAGNLFATNLTLTNALTVPNGGTGQTSLTGGAVLYGNGTGPIGAVATSTPTVTAPITYSGTLGSFVGGVTGTFGCTTATAATTGCLTGANFNTFNNKIATSAVPTIGQVAMWTGAFPATQNGISTSTPTVTGPITYSGTLGSFVGGTGGTFACATCAVFGYPFTNTPWYGSPGNSTTTQMIFTGTPWSVSASTTLIQKYLQIGDAIATITNLTPLQISSSTNNYIQAIIQNESTGNNASSNWIACNDKSADCSTYYTEIGINGSGYAQSAFSSQNSGDGYVLSSDGALVIGTASSTNALADVRIIAGGTASTSIAMRVSATSTTVGGTRARAAIGATTTGVGVSQHWPLSVNGPVNSYANLMCEIPQALGPLTGDSTNTRCGDFMWDEVITAATYSPTDNNFTAEGIPFLDVSTGATAAQNIPSAASAGASILPNGTVSTMNITNASSSPIFESWVGASTTNATSTMFITGLFKGGNSSTVGPTDGLLAQTPGFFFVATSGTSNWVAVAHDDTTAANGRYQSTSFSSTTPARVLQKMRIVVVPATNGTVTATYYINDVVVAVLTTPSSANNRQPMSPRTSVGVQTNAGLAKAMSMGPIHLQYNNTAQTY